MIGSKSIYSPELQTQVLVLALPCLSPGPVVLPAPRQTRVDAMNSRAAQDWTLIAVDRCNNGQAHNYNKLYRALALTLV